MEEFLDLFLAKEYDSSFLFSGEVDLVGFIPAFHLFQDLPNVAGLRRTSGQHRQPRLNPLQAHPCRVGAIRAAKRSGTS